MSYYNRKGEEISQDEIIEKFKNPEYKIIKQENVGGKFLSTVWLGLDHSFGQSDRILIFETMVFPSEDDLSEELCERYTTEEEALAGHERIKKDLLNKMT
jgi:hypothetical protein